MWGRGNDFRVGFGSVFTALVWLPLLLPSSIAYAQARGGYFSEGMVNRFANTVRGK